MKSVIRSACSRTFKSLGCMAMGGMIASPSFAADEWGRFRGPNGSGVASELKLSDTPTLENSLLWKVEISKGTSSPVVSQGKLFLASFDQESRTLQCMESGSGKELWVKTSKKLRDETATAPNNPATCTPVCNESMVCVLFPDTGLFVYSLNGELLWQKDIGPFYSMHGISASPILVDGKIVIVVDQLQESYILALDAKSGNELWRTDRLIGVTGGYSTPGLIEVDGMKLILSAAPGEMVAYDVATGEKKFSTVGLTNAPVGVPVIAGNRLYFSEPPGEPIPMAALGNADKNSDGVIELEEVKKSVGATRLIERIDRGYGDGDGKVNLEEWDRAFGTFLNRGGLSCLELTREGDSLKGEVKWQYTKSTPYIPSVILVDGFVYIINDGGILLSFDADSGKLVKRDRLSSATGQYYASPVAGSNTIAFANSDGVLSLVQAGKDWEMKSTIQFEEAIFATPTIHDGMLYVRTDRHLYCLGTKKG